MAQDNNAQVTQLNPEGLTLEELLAKQAKARKAAEADARLREIQKEEDTIVNLEKTISYARQEIDNIETNLKALIEQPQKRLAIQAEISKLQQLQWRRRSQISQWNKLIPETKNTADLEVLQRSISILTDEAAKTNHDIVSKMSEVSSFATIDKVSEIFDAERKRLATLEERLSSYESDLETHRDHLKGLKRKHWAKAPIRNSLASIKAQLQNATALTPARFTNMVKSGLSKAYAAATGFIQSNKGKTLGIGFTIAGASLVTFMPELSQAGSAIFDSAPNLINGANLSMITEAFGAEISNSVASNVAPEILMEAPLVDIAEGAFTDIAVNIAEFNDTAITAQQAPTIAPVNIEGDPQLASIIDTNYQIATPTNPIEVNDIPAIENNHSAPIAVADFDNTHNSIFFESEMVQPANYNSNQTLSNITNQFVNSSLDTNTVQNIDAPKTVTVDGGEAILNPAEPLNFAEPFETVAALSTEGTLPLNEPSTLPSHQPRLNFVSNPVLSRA